MYSMENISVTFPFIYQNWAVKCIHLLIHSRIYEILPQRIQQWQQSPCIAEEHGKKQLERIRREQQNARLRLTDMERRFHELEGIIAKAKQQAVQQDEEVSKLESVHSLSSTACFTVKSWLLFFFSKHLWWCYDEMLWFPFAGEWRW